MTEVELVAELGQTREALFAEFDRTPIGHHSPALERLLLKFRGAPVAGKYVLLVLEPHRRWTLATLTGQRGDPVRPIANRVFTDLLEAERAVFRLRWQALVGGEADVSLDYITGYADQISVAPGETIRFMVSARGTTTVAADVVRTRCGDRNPAGPGFSETPVVTGIEGRYPVEERHCPAGSFLRAPDSPRLTGLESFTLQVMVWPTLPGRAEQALLGSWSATARQGFVAAARCAGRGDAASRRRPPGRGAQQRPPAAAAPLVSARRQLRRGQRTSHAVAGATGTGRRRRRRARSEARCAVAVR